MFHPRLALAVVGVVAVGAGAASAHHNGVPKVDHYIFRDGTAQLIANPGGHPVSWQRCLPDAACEPFDDGDGSDQILRVTNPPRGTRFVATQDGTSVSSEWWKGPLRATAPPGLEGEPRVGQLIRPLPGSWEGGWGRERDWLQVQSCRTAEGEGCVVLIDEVKYGRCEPEGGRYVPEKAVGRWLRVLAVRVDRDQAFTAEGYEAPERVHPIAPGGPGVAVATFGPVQEGTPRLSGCAGGSDPTIRFLDVHRLPAPEFAVVHCPLRCVIEWAVRQRRHAFTARRTVPDEGITVLAIAREKATRFRRGRATVRVRVDGRLLAARAVRLAGPAR